MRNENVLPQVVEKCWCCESAHKDRSCLHACRRICWPSLFTVEFLKPCLVHWAAVFALIYAVEWENPFSVGEVMFRQSLFNKTTNSRGQFQHNVPVNKADTEEGFVWGTGAFPRGRSESCVTYCVHLLLFVLRTGARLHDMIREGYHSDSGAVNTTMFCAFSLTFNSGF